MCGIESFNPTDRIYALIPDYVHGIALTGAQGKLFA